MNRVELLMVLASALLHAGWSAAIKGSRDPLAFNLVQTVVAAAVALGMLAVVRLDEIPRAVWQGAALTGVAHASYMYFLGRAFERGELTLVYPIVRSTPALLPLIAVPLLGETLSPAGVAGIGVVVGGVWLVQTEGAVRWGAFRNPGTGFALLALGTTVVYSLVDKRSMAAFSDAAWTSDVPRAVVYFFLLYVATALIFVPLSLRRVPVRSWPRRPRGASRIATDRVRDLRHASRRAACRGRVRGTWQTRNASTST